MDQPLHQPLTPPRFAARATACSERGARQFFRSAACTSAESPAAAEAQARQLARKRAEAAAEGIRLDPALDRYPYPERTLVEPVLQRVTAPAEPGREIARLTRNAYGASVLNAYGVMFVDVDTTEDTSNAVAEVVVEKRQAVEALARVCGQRDDLFFRVYATKAGLRYLCTSRLFDPAAAETQALLEQLLSDKRYRVLCRVQKCFRARLTPKPWRCEAAVPPAGGFFKALFRARVPARPDYDAFAACQFLHEVGRAGARHEEAQQIAILHDTLSGALSGKPLA